MNIQLKPEFEALLKAQVDLGNYPSLEAALEAAIRTLAADPIDVVPDGQDLTWAKPVDATSAGGRKFTGEKVWAPLKERFSDQKR